MSHTTLSNDVFKNVIRHTNSSVFHCCPTKGEQILSIFSSQHIDLSSKFMTLGMDLGVSIFMNQEDFTMDMGKQVLCCEDCYQKIHKRSKRAALLWLELCMATPKIEGNIIAIEDCKCPSLKVLENMGFVVTLDVLDELLIKMNGATENPFSSIFCICE